MATKTKTMAKKPARKAAAGSVPAKIDFKKKYRELYFPKGAEPVTVNVPDMQYIMIDGEGDPNKSKAFQECCEVLYGLSYTIKFMCKKDPVKPFDFTVAPLEGLWYSCGDTGYIFKENKRGEWKWTLMVMQPAFVTKAMYVKACEELKRKKNPALLDQARFEAYSERLAAQIMHTGPYSEERPTIEKLHQFVYDSGYELHLHHHEIYLGDPRKSAPEKLKTLIRHPVRKAK